MFIVSNLSDIAIEFLFNNISICTDIINKSLKYIFKKSGRNVLDFKNIIKNNMNL